ncbi:TetR family transcriptional regulator [Actinocatenispora thailandica]|uniref:TetR family transcriptional regulator n=1 Tax=Actinocatenispora thailandica TaxID=227318 RepID=A0A7R7DWA9_9ACTN|nr:TetR/AcrR family transcriptional regulator [Actinocatenispora thailandica]BCJ38795.1 TetR family transcriptional regulator [Actinocatenispora thailandica]
MARPRKFDDDEVIDRAMDAFWTNGYFNTSPAQLAEATGIGKGSLYNAFNSKRELFDRALNRYDVLGAEFAEKCLSEPGSTRENIAGFLNALVTADLAGPVRRGCLAVNTSVELAGQDPEIERAVRRMQERTIAALADRIARGRRDGDVDPGVDPRAYAEFLMNTIVGLRVMAKTNDAPMLHRIIDSALAAL